MLLLWVILQFIVSSDQVHTRREQRDVVTTQGVVRGYRKTEPPHYAFLGVPYASPPVRFKAPEPPPKWSGIFEATHRVQCPQPGDDVPDENCLVVNVFVPAGAQAAPVVVHVHDGDFHHGSGIQDGPTRLLRQNIVFVSINYRLGPLGFLCLSVKGARGNAGLKDQVAALYWVHRNIRNFGGNPKQVTLYGTGAGAASVHLLLISKSTNGLIHRVILESGSALSKYALTYNPIGLAEEASILLKEPKQNNIFDSAILKIYWRYLSADLGSILKTFNFWKNETTDNNLRFAPCIEKNFLLSPRLLEEEPMITLQRGDYHRVPLLVTYTKSRKMNELDLEEHTLIEQVDVLPNNLEFPDNNVKVRLLNMINDFYFKNTEIKEVKMESYSKYLEDLSIYPIIKSALLHANKGEPVYLLEFSYKESLDYGHDMNQNNKSNKSAAIFTYISGKEKPMEDDVISYQLTTLWNNFIHYGDPTPLATPIIPVWDPLLTNREDMSSIKVLQIGNTLAMRHLSFINRMMFWDKIYTNFYKIHTMNN